MPELIPAAAAPASVRDEGSTVVQGATALNFTGAGVVASDAGGGVATINIPGGSVGAVNWGDIGGTLSSQTDLNNALAAKAPLSSPTFTGTPAAPTAAGGTNTTQLATTAFVQQEISSNKYVDGEVETYADLPTAVPPAVGAAYLVRTASGVWLINRKPAGIYVRTASAGVLADWTYAGTFPDVFSDDNFSVYDGSDSTKEMGFSLGGITAGQKRILTPLDKNYTVEETGHASKHASAGSDPITISQSQVTNLTTDLSGKLSTSGTAADVNPAGTSIAAALAGKLSTSGTAADVNVSGTAIAAALAGKLSTSGTAADVNVSGTAIAAALAGKLSTSGTAADVNVSGTNISAALSGKLSTSGIAADVNPAGTSIAAALAAKVATGGALGTPSSGTLTNCTGLPEAGLTLADNTTANASTSAHGLLLKATAPSSGVRNVVCIDNGETAYKNAALIDSTNPADIGTAAPGTSLVAARRDHVHAIPSAHVSNAMLANMAANTIKGRITASTGAPEDLSAANVKTILALTFADLAAGTMAASATFGENTALIYDAALSADGKYCGFVRTGTAGTTLAFGDLVYLQASDSRWELADADAASTSGDVLLGMCVLAANADGDTTTILLMGFIRADAAFPSLTIGAPAYVSTTAGDIQTAQPSGTDDVIRRVGFAWTADELYFNPSSDYATHT